MRSWRNWQTRYLQAVVGLPVRVQISPTAPFNNSDILVNVFFLFSFSGQAVIDCRQHTKGEAELSREEARFFFVSEVFFP